MLLVDEFVLPSSIFVHILTRRWSGQIASRSSWQDVLTRDNYRLIGNVVVKVRLDAINFDACHCFRSSVDHRNAWLTSSTILDILMHGIVPRFAWVLVPKHGVLRFRIHFHALCSVLGGCIGSTRVPTVMVQLAVKVFVAFLASLFQVLTALLEWPFVRG